MCSFYYMSDEQQGQNEKLSDRRSDAIDFFAASPRGAFAHLRRRVAKSIRFRRFNNFAEFTQEV